MKKSLILLFLILSVSACNINVEEVEGYDPADDGINNEYYYLNLEVDELVEKGDIIDEDYFGSLIERWNKVENTPEKDVNGFTNNFKIYER
jgi:hypothetical protein